MLATLADVAIARALAQTRDNKERAATINLNLDFIGAAAEGAWIEAHIDIKKEAGSIAFCVCEIKQADKDILVATGAFKFVKPRNS